MTRLSAWIAGVLVVICAFMCAAVAQTRPTDMSQAPGVLPSGLGDAVDRDVAKIRDATARFKTTEAAEAAGYKRVTDCVEYQPAGAMGYHFQNNALLDATLDVDHPEVLVYEKKPDGAFKLNGVEFLVPISAWTPAEPPRIWGKLSKRRIAWASGTSTSGRGSRVRAVYLPTGTPTSSAGTLIDAIIRSPGPRDSTGRPV